MWVRKSETEIQRVIAEKKLASRSIKKPLIIAAIVFVVAIFFDAIGYRGGLSRGFIILASNHNAMDEIVRDFPFTVAFTVIAFVFFYIRQVRNDGIPTGVETFLCNRCFEPQQGMIYSNCQCGGRLEPFDYFDDIEAVAKVVVTEPANKINHEGH